MIPAAISPPSGQSKTQRLLASLHCFIPPTPITVVKPKVSPAASDAVEPTASREAREKRENFMDSRGQKLVERTNQTFCNNKNPTMRKSKLVWQKAIVGCGDPYWTRVIVKAKLSKLESENEGESDILVRAKWVGATHNHGGSKPQDLANEQFWLQYMYQYIPNMPRVLHFDVKEKCLISE